MSAFSELFDLICDFREFNAAIEVEENARKDRVADELMVEMAGDNMDLEYLLLSLSEAHRRDRDNR